VRWLRASSAKYHIDANHIGAIGWSSGGQLSLMLGLLDAIPELNETDNLECSSKVQAVVSLGGPTELALMYHQATYPGISDVLTELIGGSPEQLPSKYREASPVYYVTANASPVLMIQGDQDDEVPPNQATLFAEEMTKKGISATVIVLKRSGHINAYYNNSIFPFFDGILKTKK
jgi:dipeptidyl aminopeptidase/acylaminoacyl peptidase